MTEHSPDDLRHSAAVNASALIEALDDGVLHQHTAAVDELEKLGLLIARTGVEPYVVLGQMSQAVAVAFADRIMPRYKVAEIENGSES